MTELTIAWLAAASAGVVVAMSALLAFKKAARSRAERTSRLRRARYGSVLVTGSDAELRAIASAARRRRAPQEDLAVALDVHFAELSEERLRRFRIAATDRGLARAIRRGLQARRAPDRARAALLFARLRLTGAVAALEELLFDRDPDVQHAALSGVSLTATDAAAWALLRGLCAGALPRERIVERLGHRWAVPALLEVLECDELGSIRGDTAESLGLAGDCRAIVGLVRLLESGGDEERVQACRALRRMASPGLAEDFVRALGDEFWPVAAQAARALQKVGDVGAVPALEAGLASSHWWVRANCAEALVRIRGAGMAALRRALDHPDRFARERATEAIAIDAVRRGARADGTVVLETPPQRLHRATMANSPEVPGHA
jgi:HEAT repeat protein